MVRMQLCTSWKRGEANLNVLGVSGPGAEAFQRVSSQELHDEYS